MGELSVVIVKIHSITVYAKRFKSANFLSIVMDAFQTAGTMKTLKTL